MLYKDYFDHIYIVHLPERTDRYRELSGELDRIGVNIEGPNVSIPFAPKPDSKNGFASKGVYGSFLSHLGILKEGLNAGFKRFLILEDDAIFSKRMVTQEEAILQELDKQHWDFCYFGHTLHKELKDKPRGWVDFSGPFYWAHCYAVNVSILPRIISYLEETLTNPPSHEKGGKVYIDAAYTLFRKMNPDVKTLVANPVLSIQRGSPSSLAGRWYARKPALQPFLSPIRKARDEIWRRTDMKWPRP